MRMSDQSVSKVDQLKRLKSDYEELTQQVKEDLLSQIHRAISQLEEIGYKYTLQEASDLTGSDARPQKRPSRPAPTENFDPGKTCIICDAIGHDGRAHRRQVRGRRPFTIDELVLLGLSPPPIEATAKGAA